MNVLDNGHVFVAWRWEWNIDEENEFDGFESDDHDQSASSESFSRNIDPQEISSDSDQGDMLDTQVTHTVTFKCIGVTRERGYQDTLKQANQLLKQKIDVPVRLFHEKSNPYDSRALAIQCKLPDKDWKRIGYVVKEALEETHKARQNDDVVLIKFGWIKYITDYRMSGPGYFAGIDITRKGEWPSSIVRCSSHRNF